MRPSQLGLTFGFAVSICFVVGFGGSSKGLQKSSLHSLTLLNGQLFGAAPGDIRLLDANGGQTEFVKVPFQSMSLAPFGTKLLVADRARKAIFTLDSKSKQLVPLFTLDSVSLEAKSIPPDSLLRQGTLNSIASDGKTVYVGIGAGFSSAIFQIDPSSKRVVSRQWAGSDDPHDMAFGDGSVYVMNPQYNEIRRFTGALQRTTDEPMKSLPGAHGLVIQNGGLLMLDAGGLNIIRQPAESQFLSSAFLKTRLDLNVNSQIINHVPWNSGILNTLAPQKYAVLITGDRAQDFAGECFWNDTVWIYKQLRNNGYLPQNIFVCYGDGTDYASADPFYQYPHTITNFSWNLQRRCHTFHGPEKR